MQAPRTSALLAAFASLAALAQPPGPAFEAASVKPADPKSAPANAANDAQATLRGGPGTADPGRISYANVTLQSLLITAYGAGCKIQAEECDQISGPVWLHQNRYDVEAKIPPGATMEQFRSMLQNLLAERFHMVLHHEMRDLPGYELTLGKATKLKPSPEATATPDDAPPGPLVKFGAVGEYPQLLRAGFIIAPYKGTRATANHLIAREQTSGDIAGKMLSPLLNTHVVDKTGLAGKYDFTLDWVPDGVNLVQEADGPDLSPPHGIPTALEDQLGLKLVRTKVTLDTVIVDSADRVPSGN
jgi:uncharacterized protein (TIGR03435 family)